MKKILFALSILLFSGFGFGYETYTPKGTVDTWAPVNPVTGAFALKQDEIDSPNSGQTTRSLVTVTGRKTASLQNVGCDLWDGPTCTYVWPASAQQMRLVSTSANDALTGTGIQKMVLHYLDANYVQRDEIVSLNGTTPVLTVATNILRINGMHAYQVGSGVFAAGNIALTNLANTVTYSYLSANLNTARQAFFTVPAGKNLFINHWQASSGSATGTHFTVTFIVTTSHFGTLLPGMFLVIDETGTLNGGIAVNFPIPVRIPATADVKFVAISDAANANVTALGAFMGWLETAP